MKEHRQRMAEENTEFEKAQGKADSNLMFFFSNGKTSTEDSLYFLHNFQLVCRQ